MTDRAKLADAIDPRKLVPDSVMGGCTFIIDNADLIAASDALRAMGTDGKPGIIAAAIRNESGEVFHLLPPARHHNVLHFFGKENCHEQGFLTSNGEFVGREVALNIAIAAGQLKPRLPDQYNGPELFSEDLW